MRRLWTSGILLAFATVTAWSEAIQENQNIDPLKDSASVELPEMRVRRKKQEENPEKMKTDFLRKIPNAMNDPVRAVSFLPGVAVQNDVNARPFVRGGEAEQTRVLWNGISLLQPYHLGGSFSTVNSGSLESVELFREDFPVEYPGALSGILRLQPKQHRFVETRLNTDLSLVRGDVFIGLPVAGSGLGIYGAGQSFLFNHSLHGLLDLSSLFSRDSLYQQDIQNYRNHINLPAFQDYHWGAYYSARENLRFDYSGGFFRDDYAVVVPKQLNILPAPNPNPNPNPIPIIPIIPTEEIKRSKRLAMDSVSAVDIPGHMHFLRTAWDAGSRHFVESDFGYQSQKWDVDFKKAPAMADPFMLSQSTLLLSGRVVDTYAPSEGHTVKFGMSYDYKREKYRAELPYVLYEVIVSGNMDMLEPLGFFSHHGFQIVKEDSTRSNFDYLGEYPARIAFSHEGELHAHTGGAFFSHSRESPSGVLTYGLRGEYHSGSKEFFPAPRLSYLWKMSAKNEVGFHSGLYSQNDLAFYKRDRNQNLKAEKSAQSGLKWSHRFTEGYRFAAQAYYKRYFDLVVPVLTPDGSIDLDGFLLPHPGSGLSEYEIGNLKAILDTTTSFQTLPDSTRQAALATFGNLVFDYRNGGVGNSLGSEFSFFYSPTPRWNGWASADFSVSNRKDHETLPYYDYRYHRPLVFNWVNYFDMPGAYEIAFTYRWAMGQPYTPYSGTLDGTGSTAPIVIGARNSGRLAPYNRLDIRLSRSLRRWKTDIKTYVEVWNAMNIPNYFARDVNTGELKAAQLNWPFPLFFVGMSADF